MFSTKEKNVYLKQYIHSIETWEEKKKKMMIACTKTFVISLFFFIFYIALLLLPCLSYQKQLLKYLLLRYSMELFWEGREHREHEEKE